MKFLSALALILCVFSSSAFASGYNFLKIDGYDRQTSRYYYGIENDEDGDNRYVNIAVYDIKSNKLVHIFPIGNTDQITDFYYQAGFSAELSRAVLNNEDLENQNSGKSVKMDYSRASQNLIIVTYSRKEKNHLVWLCGKSGEGLRQIAAFGDTSRMEIDTYFNKILIIKTERNRMSIDQYPY